MTENLTRNNTWGSVIRDSTHKIVHVTETLRQADCPRLAFSGNRPWDGNYLAGSLLESALGINSCSLEETKQNWAEGEVEFQCRLNGMSQPSLLGWLFRAILNWDKRTWPILRSVSHWIQATLEGAWPWEMRQLFSAEAVSKETGR